jgi:hypothetical protein
VYCLKPMHHADGAWTIELPKILECKETKGLIVPPVFYKVDPSDARIKRRVLKKHWLNMKKGSRMTSNCRGGRQP